jgi:hypothetical protein
MRLTKLASPLIMALFSLAATACDGSPAALPCGKLPGRPVPLLVGGNVPAIDSSHRPYNSSPPTSGPHVPFTAAPGPYDEQIPDEVQVRALEFGHVLIQYGQAVRRDSVTHLERFARRYPRDVLVAPYSPLGSEIALTAWGRIELLHRADEPRINRFVRALARRYTNGWRHGAHPCPGNA